MKSLKEYRVALKLVVLFLGVMIVVGTLMATTNATILG